MWFWGGSGLPGMPMDYDVVSWLPVGRAWWPSSFSGTWLSSSGVGLEDQGARIFSLKPSNALRVSGLLGPPESMQKSGHVGCLIMASTFWGACWSSGFPKYGV